MKVTSRICVVVVILVALISLAVGATKNHSGSARRVRPSCIGCGWVGDCRSCESNGGFQHCRTPDCSTCSESDGCDLELESVEGQGQVNVQSARGKSRTFRINSAIIKEVGAKHPRFGATLANFNMFGFSAGVHRVHWTPVAISSEDMDRFIDRSAHQSFFKKYNQRASKINRQIQRGEVAEVLYIVTIGQQDSHTWTVKLQVAGNSAPILTTSDPAYSSLELTALFNDMEVENLKASKVNWHIN